MENILFSALISFAETAAKASSVAVKPSAADLDRLRPEDHAVPLPAWFAMEASGGCPLTAPAFPPLPRPWLLSPVLSEDDAGNRDAQDAQRVPGGMTPSHGTLVWQRPQPVAGTP